MKTFIQNIRALYIEANIKLKTTYYNKAFYQGMGVNIIIQDRINTE